MCLTTLFLLNVSKAMGSCFFFLFCIAEWRMDVQKDTPKLKIEHSKKLLLLVYSLS